MTNLGNGRVFDSIADRHSDFRNQISNLSNAFIWNEIAAEFESTFPIDALPLEDFLRGARSVVDFGCGSGRISCAIHEISRVELICCDIALAPLFDISKKLPEARTIFLSDPNDLPFHKVSYDRVMLVGVLSSIVPAVERENLVRQAWGSLPETGRILIADFGVSDLPMYKKRYSECALEPNTFRASSGLLIHHFYAEELKDLGQVMSGNKLVFQNSRSVQTTNRNTVPGHVVMFEKKCSHG